VYHISAVGNSKPLVSVTENPAPMKWFLVELLVGGDGFTPVAVLKTASGVTRRAVNKMCLLPLKDDVEIWTSYGEATTVN